MRRNIDGVLFAVCRREGTKHAHWACQSLDEWNFFCGERDTDNKDDDDDDDKCMV